MLGIWCLVMISYIPFLKYKSNEIIALGELDSSILEKITPFFDYPKPKGKPTPDQFKYSVDRLARSVNKHIGDISEIYIDTYDLSGEFEVEGQHSYLYLLESFSDISVIPVVSVDRSDNHLQTVLSLKEAKKLSSDSVAFRVTSDDFENYAVIEYDIVDRLNRLFEAFESIDLIFDCRFCSGLDVDKISKNISKFSDDFTSKYPVRRSIVSGSSVPASISDVLPVDSECFVNRKEVDIYRSVREKSEGIEFIFGDYATVSPNYSDVSLMPEIMQNIMTAKLVYAVNSQHYFIRGGSLKTKGREQYFDLASELCSKTFFRGASYSSGDKYFDEKSKREGSNCAPGTIVKPSVNSHITYVVQGGVI